MRKAFAWVILKSNVLLKKREEHFVFVKIFQSQIYQRLKTIRISRVEICDIYAFEIHPSLVCLGTSDAGVTFSVCTKL